MDPRAPAANAPDDWQRVGRPHGGVRDQSRSHAGLLLGTPRLRLQHARGRTAANRLRDHGDLAVDCRTYEGHVARQSRGGDAMFVGHFGMALAAKRLAPRASLAVLILAAQLADVIWPVLVALGIEQVRIAPGNTAFTPLDFVAYPYSHSLLLLMVWGLVLGVLTRTHVGGRAAIPLIAGLVVSHWVLDWITHRSDMPLSWRTPPG